MSIQGLSKLNTQFNSLKSIDKQVPTVAGANVILDKAKQNAPVKTGFLRDSGKVNETDDGAEVEFDAPYAVFVEYGTFKQSAQPFLRPAVDTSHAQVLSAVGDEVQKEIGDKL